MAEVVLFHSVLGRTAGIVAFGEALRRHEHVVHTPDLFDGHTFTDIDSGVAYVDEVGFDTIVDRGVELGVAAAGSSSARVVYVGVSLGAMPAQRLAQTQPGAAGALLIEGCAPATAFGDGWPPHVPVQIHGADGDPFFAGEGDIDNARSIVGQASATTYAELFVYPGDQHLFTDSSHVSHDAAATELVLERVLAFLEQIDRASGEAR